MAGFTFSDILELDLAELMELEAAVALVSSDIASYRAVLIAYFRASPSALTTEIEKQLLGPELLRIAKVRLAILNGHLNDEFFESVAHVSFTESENGSVPVRASEAEFNFVLSIAALKAGRFALAASCALQAEQHFASLKLSKKEVKSSFNALVAQTHLYPESRFIADYERLAEKAELAGEWAVGVTAQLNISRELQKIGANDLALLRAENAVENAIKCGAGSRELGFARLQRVSILESLGRATEAAQELARAQMIDHPEIKAAVSSLDQANLTPHRLARFRETAKDVASLGDMESNLISLLLERPRDFNSLAELLYLDVVDVFSRRERLKNLIARVRKKQPGLVVFQSGKYEISKVLETKAKRPAR